MPWSEGEAVYGEGYKDARLNVIPAPTLNHIVSLPDGAEFVTVIVAPFGLGVKTEGVTMGPENRAMVQETIQHRIEDHDGDMDTGIAMMVVLMPDFVVPDVVPSDIERKDA